METKGNSVFKLKVFESDIGKVESRNMKDKIRNEKGETENRGKPNLC
jgi:hypothetical protein